MILSVDLQTCIQALQLLHSSISFLPAVVEETVAPSQTLPQQWRCYKSLSMPPEQQQLSTSLPPTANRARPYICYYFRILNPIFGYFVNQQPIIIATCVPLFQFSIQLRNTVKVRDNYPSKQKCFYPRTGKVSSFFYSLTTSLTALIMAVLSIPNIFIRTAPGPL